MSATTPIPDNALLLWLQDESNNECTTAESAIMHTNEFDPISHFQQDDRQHCFLIFEKVNEDSIPNATILHQLAVVPTCIGNPSTP